MAHVGDVGTEIAPAIPDDDNIRDLAAFAGATLDALRAARGSAAHAHS